MRLPSALANGRSRARAPVATMMCLAASSVVLPSAPATLQLAFPGQLALAHHDRDLVLLHQVRDALVELLGDRAAARDDLGDVERGLLVAEAVGVGVLHVVEHLGRAQQRLGRDAAPVEADAAEQLALDDRGLEAELRRADRGDIAAGPGAEDDEVVGVRHWTLRLAPLPLRERGWGEGANAKAERISSPTPSSFSNMSLFQNRRMRKPCAFEIGVASCVARAFGMLAAINFDDQPARKADEIHNVKIQRNLLFELVTREAMRRSAIARACARASVG